MKYIIIWIWKCITSNINLRDKIINNKKIGIKKNHAFLNLYTDNINLVNISGLWSLERKIMKIYQYYSEKKTKNDYYLKDHLSLFISSNKIITNN